LQCVAGCCRVWQGVAVFCRVDIFSETLRTRPRTEEIGLKTITTAKISNKFSRESPYISNTFSVESTNFHTRFHVCKWSLRRSKDISRKSINQIFYV